MLLEVRNVSKNYASHCALSDVSMQIPEKCIYGLLGPNGAGKTSLIRIINQITAPDTGEILFNGDLINQNHVSQIGYLPEERGLYKKMKVGEQALYLAQLKGMRKSEAEEKLRSWFIKFDIFEWWDKAVEELSKGMAQKVQFITTVLHEPKLLILDEPFSGFDPINTQLIKKEILELRKNGATVIFSTHNMGSVEEICDRIALINHAKVILEGEVNEIRNTYRSNTIELHFKGNYETLTAALSTNFEIESKNTQDDLNIVKIKKLNGATTNNLLQSIIGQIEIIAVNDIIPTMNDIFINMVSSENNKSVEKERVNE